MAPTVTPPPPAAAQTSLLALAEATENVTRRAYPWAPQAALANGRAVALSALSAEALDEVAALVRSQGGDDGAAAAAATDVPAEATRAGRGSVALIALRSGKFAGCVFGPDGAPKRHQVFSRYTTRRGQGGAQAAMDNTGRKVKSVGSTLRRAGERALAEEVTLLLRETWRADLEACEGVYVACARAMRPLLFGKNDVPACVDARDPRVQKIPLASRSRLAHVVAAYERLTTVFFHAPAPADPPPPPPPAEKAEEKAAAAPVVAEAPVASSRRGRGSGGRRGLGGGAVPAPLDDEAVKAKKQREAEKKKRQRERQKQQKAEAKARAEADAEARAAADAAAKLKAAEDEKRNRCASCGGAVRGEPFRRLEFLYCASACVQAHRRELSPRPRRRASVNGRHSDTACVGQR
ncbi:hypothetical protein JL720_2451 [Aureococcus anophagefferens]|nr:hypothetical protein JL720_2451 [Aureococcus anophagefferens]